MGKLIKTSNKSKLNLGYRLHARRLDYSGCESIRAIKYPLVGSDNLNDTLSSYIEQDLVNLIGPSNIDEYQKYENHYSVLDFYLDTLRLGFVFQPTPSKLIELIEIYHYGESSSLKIFDSIKNSDIKNALDKDKFIEKIILNSGARKGKSTVDSLNKRIIGVFNKSEQENDMAVKIAGTLSEKLLLLNKKGQKKLIWETFTIGCDIPEGSDREFTYTLYPLTILKPEIGLDPIKVIERNWSYCQEIIPTIDVKSVVGLGNNGNALSNYLNIFVKELVENKENNYLNALYSVADFSSDEKEDIENRVKKLKSCAKKLAKPNLTKSWADYRTIFSGKIEPTVTIYKKRNEEIHEDLEKKFEELEELKKQDLPKTILENIDILIKINNSMLGTIDRQEYDLYENLLSNLRTDLNLNYQESNKELSEESEKDRPEKKYPNIFSRLKKLPEFFGIQKRREIIKYLNAPDKYEKMIKLLDFIELEITKEAVDVDEDYFLKQIDKLIKLYPRLQNKKIRKDLEEIFVELFGKIPEYRNNLIEVAKKNPRSKDRRVKELVLKNKPENFTNYLLDLSNKIGYSLTLNDRNPEVLIECLEIKKIVFSWIVKIYFKDSVMVDVSKHIDGLERAKIYTDLEGTSLTGEKLQRFLSWCVFSEMRGYLTKLSLKRFISRDVVQVDHSEESFLLTNVINPEFGSSKSIVQFISLPEEIELIETSGHLYTYKDKDNDSKKEGNNVLRNPMNIRTSRYQMQFLDWFYRGTQRKKSNVMLKRQSPTLSLEKIIQINWDFKSKKPDFSILRKNIYYIQPFDLIPSSNSKDRKSFIKDGRENYIGVDIGEYGLAFVACNPKKGEVLESGFIYDSSYRKLREEVDKLVQRQQLGTFSIQSTKISLMREHIVGTLKNMLHTISIKYNAKLIYEWEVSAFEEGSNKIRKLYNTLKVSDVRPETDADKAVVSNTWGKNTVMIGNHVGAYGTSQLCSKCNKSVLTSNIDNKNYLEAEEISKNIVKIQQSDGSYLHVFLRNGVSKNDLSDMSKVKQGAHDFMRPPLDGEVIKHFVNESYNLEDFARDRGNSAVFVCPFCKHVSDADIQAALNIAVKGYLNDIGKKSKSNTKKGDIESNREPVDLEKLSSYMRGKFKPIDLVV